MLCIIKISVCVSYSICVNELKFENVEIKGESKINGIDMCVIFRLVFWSVCIKIDML